MLFPHRFHIGKAGDGGGRAKLAINLILGLNRMALAEGIVFASRLGLDAKAFLDVARASAAYSQVMDIKGRKMVEREFGPEGFVHQSLKDFTLMHEQAARLRPDAAGPGAQQVAARSLRARRRSRLRQQRRDRGNPAAAQVNSGAMQ